MTMKAVDIFHYLRGAVRSAYGIENFRDRTFVIAGMEDQGQDLLSMLCFEGVDVKFIDPSITNYQKSFAVCSSVNVFENEEEPDILIDFTCGKIKVKEKDISISSIGEKPYEQGIHDYYLK